MKNVDQQIFPLLLKMKANNIELSSRTLSDVIEKHVISFAIDFFGENNVKYGNWSGYDVIIVDFRRNNGLCEY